MKIIEKYETKQQIKANKERRNKQVACVFDVHDNEKVLTDTIGYDKSKYKIRSTNNITDFDGNNTPLEFYYKIKDNDIKLEEVEKIELNES